MELNNKQIIDAINILKNADGEDLHFILSEIGMDDQLLKQLVVTSPKLSLLNAIEENGILKNTAYKVWKDIFNNDTLVYNDFESYWENLEKG
jgi:ATP phosphoribosyltransferase regulatory subunit HisZ